MEEREGRATIRDIAERAGVSKATVSFAFNSPEKISARTRERVMMVAEELGYVPDPVARRLATKRLGTIGLLLPQPIQEVFQNPYMFEILQGIGMVCHAEDLSLTILPPVKGFLSQTVRNAAVDALVTIGIASDAPILSLVRKRRIPFVTIDGTPSADSPNVGIDDEDAGFQLMRHVLGLGHRRLAVLTIRAALGSASESGAGADPGFSRTLEVRLAGFERALEEIGSTLHSPDVAVHACEASMGAARDLASGLLSRGPRPTAIVCMSDAAALGCFSAARSAGLRIPADLSVAGFDDIPFAALACPPLTTVRQPGYEKGYAAARVALDLLRGRPGADARLAARLVVRDSTGPAPLGA